MVHVRAAAWCLTLVGEYWTPDILKCYHAPSDADVDRMLSAGNTIGRGRQY